MATSISVLGHAVERREDRTLLVGSARYVADVPVDGVLEAYFVRSQVAHGLIRGVDFSAALSAPGVVAVFVAADLQLNDLAEFTRGGPGRPELSRPCLASDRVRYVGEPVAVVVATSPAEAVDAAELVILDIEGLAPVVDPIEAMEDGAPLLFPGHGSNVVLSGAMIFTGEGSTGADGDPPHADVLEGAEVVVRASFRNQRVAPVPLETNAALVMPLADGTLDCVFSTQAPFRGRAAVADALGIPEDNVRVRTVSVGGGFGAKGGTGPEQIVTAAVAARLGRPVRHVETRSENLVAMTHGRGQVQEVELGAKRDGTIVGLRARTVTEVGAYCWRGGIPFLTGRVMATGVYKIPRLELNSFGVVTNTSPVGPYRGAGRPEATTMLERSLDLLAVELGIDNVELRRMNMLQPSDFPYTTPTGASYDSGEYQRALDSALELAGYDRLRCEQQRRRLGESSRQLGIGISTFVEISGSGSEYGAVEVDRDGVVTLVTGASPHGQGLETVLSQVASSVLGVPPEEVRVVHSDTAVVPRGIGTFGSRSGQLAGNAVLQAAETVRERARELAAELLEAAIDDIVVTPGGAYSVTGTPAIAVSLAEVAAFAQQEAAEEPEGEGNGALAAEADFLQAEGTFPFGAHVAVVEVDTETGKVELIRFVAVDDCGVILNPVIVHGQVHGGVAQGIAQALYEEFRYDEAGNPLTTTLADYEFPSAAELPSFEIGETVTPSPRNALGVKGIGESGSVGSSAAVQNAVLDALAPFGVRHLDMPLTPEKVWRALAESR